MSNASRFKTLNIECFQLNTYFVRILDKISMQRWLCHLLLLLLVQDLGWVQFPLKPPTSFHSEIYITHTHTHTRLLIPLKKKKNLRMRLFSSLAGTYFTIQKLLALILKVTRWTSLSHAAFSARHNQLQAPQWIHPLRETKSKLLVLIGGDVAIMKRNTINKVNQIHKPFFPSIKTTKSRHRF